MRQNQSFNVFFKMTSFNFVSIEKFTNILNEYLDSLPSNRRQKALITQDLADNIQEVLLNPNTKNHSAKFRIWSRQHFSTLSINNVSQIIDKNSLKAVCLKDNLYGVIGGLHQELQHAGYRKTHQAVSNKVS